MKSKKVNTKNNRKFIYRNMIGTPKLGKRRRGFLLITPL